MKKLLNKMKAMRPVKRTENTPDEKKSPRSREEAFDYVGKHFGRAISRLSER